MVYSGRYKTYAHITNTRRAQTHFALVFALTFDFEPPFFASTSFRSGDDRSSLNGSNTGFCTGALALECACGRDGCGACTVIGVCAVGSEDACDGLGSPLDACWAWKCAEGMGRGYGYGCGAWGGMPELLVNG